AAAFPVAEEPAPRFNLTQRHKVHKGFYYNDSTNLRAHSGFVRKTTCFLPAFLMVKTPKP
ncbi:MAG: hypothetical protein PHG96_12430, partial [Kiritimatiellae bacterium]|nr:hypothetical protein [Kiritimatiellia bacterium]